MFVEFNVGYPFAVVNKEGSHGMLWRRSDISLVDFSSGNVSHFSISPVKISSVVPGRSNFYAISEKRSIVQISTGIGDPNELKWEQFECTAIEETDNCLLVGTRDGQIVSVYPDGQRRTVAISEDNWEITCITAFHQQIYAGLSNGYVIIPERAQIPDYGDENSPVRAIEIIGEDQLICVFRESGLSIISESYEEFKRFEFTEGLIQMSSNFDLLLLTFKSENGIKIMLYDPENNSEDIELVYEYAGSETKEALCAQIPVESANENGCELVLLGSSFFLLEKLDFYQDREITAGFLNDIVDAQKSSSILDLLEQSNFDIQSWVNYSVELIREHVRNYREGLYSNYLRLCELRNIQASYSEATNPSFEKLVYTVQIYMWLESNSRFLNEIAIPFQERKNTLEENISYYHSDSGLMVSGNLMFESIWTGPHSFLSFVNEIHPDNIEDLDEIMLFFMFELSVYDKEAAGNLVNEFVSLFNIENIRLNKLKGFWHVDALFDTKSDNLNPQKNEFYRENIALAISCLTSSLSIIDPKEGQNIMKLFYLAGALNECVKWSLYYIDHLECIEILMKILIDQDKWAQAFAYTLGKSNEIFSSILDALCPLMRKANRYHLLTYLPTENIQQENILLEISRKWALDNEYYCTLLLRKRISDKDIDYLPDTVRHMIRELPFTISKIPLRTNRSENTKSQLDKNSIPSF